MNTNPQIRQQITKQIEFLLTESSRVKTLINSSGFDCTTAPFLITKRYRDELKAHIKLLTDALDELEPLWYPYESDEWVEHDGSVNSPLADYTRCSVVTRSERHHRYAGAGLVVAYAKGWRWDNVLAYKVEND